MKKGFLVVVIVLFGFFLSVSLFAGGEQESGTFEEVNVIPGVLSVELIYLNHGPVRKVVTDINNLLEGYGEQIHITHYTFGSSEGESFARSKKLDGHIPMAVFIDGSMKFTVDNRSVEFISFPQGGGTGFVADGEWSVDDLRLVIDGILVQS
jgi:hypothetical protein